MRDKKEIEKEIRGDCRHYYFLPVLLGSLSKMTGKLLTIYSMAVLGKFADGIFSESQGISFPYLWQILGCILAAVLIPAVLSTGNDVVMTNASLKHGKCILKRYLNKTYEGARKLNASEVQYRLEDDQIELSNVWVLLKTKELYLPVVSGYLLYQSIRSCGWLTVLVLALAFFRLLVPMSVKNLLSAYDKQEREYKTDIRKMESELVREACNINLFGLQKLMVSRLEKRFQAHTAAFEKNNRLETVTETLMEALDPLCRIVLLLCGALGVAKGALNAGALVVMFGYFYEYNKLISDLKYMVTQLPVLRNLEERISVFYRDQESAEKEELTVLPEGVEIENLHFSYENTLGEVLRGLNIHIPLTGKIILSGKNGSGKSTLMRLILGLYPSYTGKIWLGTQELREIQPESWRKQCAYVEQNPFLFDGTVRENISLGAPSASKEEVDAVMEKLQLLPLAGQNTGGENASLSGGERQKVAIARALLKKAPLLFLDEPANHLDAEAQEWLRNFIRTYEGTILFISHDRSMLEVADHVVTL